MSEGSMRKRKKAVKACVYCRRSHMICNDKRPCSRCVKRDIAHLCHDEDQKTQLEVPGFNDYLDGVPSESAPKELIATGSKRSSFLAQHPTFVSEHVGSEFSSLNEFLTMLEDPLVLDTAESFKAKNVVNETKEGHDQPTLKENFFLTAADPSTEMTPEDRLKSVINAKLEAGLLQPYNYAQGYARLQTYMDKFMNASSKQRILKPLSIIRPEFRAIARSLKDVDLVLVEESFERMLLSYDRVFTSMSMPACLWRRTGEIYRGNKEFASLVDCKVDDLRDGKLAIYELMTEESAVNFWEKYGSIAFDKGQKAVLTSCNLRTRDGLKKRPCCFSFTIRRDRYNIPICIVGNFIPIP
ncbi:LAMI_0H06172g1_1 [Lachancea mirantina]|uniref:LAMI_0H06172g1_1 n=1 Tax=Lachancea mirantina TaxID=1230905 RepID=A0A1G4KFS6_9SACH|nr:LAMI_0H06172g1_1 [Lachancea mirantina]